MQLLISYVPILVMAFLALLVGVVPLVLACFIAPSAPNEAKSKPFECGFSPDEGMRVPFDIKYYLVAILFILFDLETAFLLPWSVCLKELGWHGFVVMMVFLGILTVGFIYEWKQDALTWRK
ncbi:NADH-quinone oxidoreductase subunit A [Candidatus Comchoanobacter bicostacola]|uniref:NADH-quinone oxidoreductase subunit A n=1 Tax=Candidatus Comchoanobacter bicostacola TaxID=2919598 RepID=A0ABY5DN25_9GAMM|nr:NADH-quinone oxidoreductase subunit A [Candidatus Comchoanobacter bicostacola]